MNSQESVVAQKITLEEFLKKELNVQSQSFGKYIESLSNMLVFFLYMDYLSLLARAYLVQNRIEDFILLTDKPVSDETMRYLIRIYSLKQPDVIETKKIFDTSMVIKSKKEDIIVNWTNYDGKIRVSVNKN
ncbi:MAG: hypothetical protein QMD50_01270 [Patescibacteria group bacterium]|nr:hypothetical protein [Patescibacteria group bacterium]